MSELINNSGRSYWDYFVDPDIPLYQRALAGAALPILGPLSLTGCDSGEATDPENNGNNDTGLPASYDDVAKDYETDRDRFLALTTPFDILQAIINGVIPGVPDDVREHVRDNLLDCDDTDPELNPRTAWYRDSDEDTYGNPEMKQLTCEQPQGFVTDANDCDDADPTAHPEGTEVPYDGIDQDCDGADVNDVDEDGVVAMEAGGTDCDDSDPVVYENVTGYLDSDGDGYTVGEAQTFCTDGTLPAGYSATQSAEDDCDDNDTNVYTPLTYYVDSDGDGHAGTTTQDICASSPPSGYYDSATDCNDSDSSVYTNQSFYVDADGDGVGSTTTGTVCASTPPSGYSNTNTDCNDGDATISANQTYYTDADSDGYGSTVASALCYATAPSGYSSDSTDCDDTEALANPGETETCDDGIDNDCSGDGSPECWLTGTYDLTSDYDERRRGTSTDQASGWSLSAADVDGDGYDDTLAGSPATDLAAPGYLFATYGDSTGLSSTYDRMSGVTTGDLAGYSVSGAGDVDGDGVEDLIVGAVNESSNATYAGAAYLVSGVDVATDSLDNVALSITYGADTNNIAGSRVAGAGDVNNDGYADILVSAPGYGYAGWYAYGAAYLNYGPLTSDIDLSASDVMITGASVTDYTGSSLSGGDVNGDGNSDILVGSYMSWDNGNDGTYGAGRADVFLGPVALGSIDINDSDIQIYGESGGDMLGFSGTVTGDIDGDGNKDIIACAYNESSVADGNGACYLFMGSSTLSGALYAGTDHATKWVGTERGVWAGESVATGDLNADGLDDVIIGANGCGGIEPSSTFIGGAYVFYSPQTAGTLSIANADAILTGESQGDCAGSAVGTGDFNGDGRKDVMVGAPYYDYTTSITNSGAMYVLLGSGE